MPSKKRLTTFVASFSIILGSVAITSPLLAASKEKVLYSFCTSNNCPDGDGPVAGLISDAAGNLYGTTEDGGAGSGCGQSGCGTVFELIPRNGKWTEKVLYSFCPTSECSDGWFPRASLVSDAAGNLYGTTYYGGAISQCYPTGCGTVFELIPHNGKWSEKVLCSFGSTCTSGGIPQGGVIFDTVGNLYGTTQYGGTYGYGTVFELTPNDGKWTEKVLHSFNNDGKDGYYPFGGVIRDKAGNLYGITPWGGTHVCFGESVCGTVFELIAQNGKWTERILHSFAEDGRDGNGPMAGLALDAKGSLYGTTENGGVFGGCGGFGCGIIFQLTLKNGKWVEKVLHSFIDRSQDGTTPVASLILDAGGNLYGTTNSGGIHGVGIAFELVRASGKWTEKVLHTFSGQPDGKLPWANLIRDHAGNFYGTTAGGGVYNGGTVFEITP